MAIVRNPVARVLFVVLGLASVGLATAGVFLPLLPTTPLVLLAGYFFARSSQKFDDWLVNHRWFGPIIRDWRAGLGFSTRAKLIAIVAIAVTFTITLTVAVTALPARLAMIGLALAISAYIVTRPTKRATASPE